MNPRADEDELGPTSGALEMGGAGHDAREIRAAWVGSQGGRDRESATGYAFVHALRV